MQTKGPSASAVGGTLGWSGRHPANLALLSIAVDIAFCSTGLLAWPHSMQSYV